MTKTLPSHNGTHDGHGVHYQNLQALSDEFFTAAGAFTAAASSICERMGAEVRSISAVVRRGVGADDVPFPFSLHSADAFEFLLFYNTNLERQVKDLRSQLHYERNKFLFFAYLADVIEAREAGEEAKREAKAAKERARRAAKKAQGAEHD